MTNGPLLARIGWLQSVFPINNSDVIPFKTAYIFGVSEWELFYTLTSGATLLICSDALVRKPPAFAEAIALCSVAFLVPSHLDMLLPSLHSTKTCHLRNVVCCGEVLLPLTVERFYAAAAAKFRTATLHNLYGPTEGSMTHHVCKRGAAEVLIGGPIDNTTVSR